VLAAAAAAVGLILGSFLNVVIHRLPRGESLVLPASRCPACRHPISAADNVPLISYLILKGRCRHCGAGISLRYPVVELLTAVLFLLAVLRFGFGPELLRALVFILLLVALAGIDLEHKLLPNALTLPGAALGLALSLLADPGGWWVYPAGAGAASGALLALAVAYPAGMGMGDVKFAALLGAFLGLYAFLALFLAALAGAISGGVLMALGRAGRRTPLPFGVFMALGAIVTLFAGEEIWAAYIDSLWGGGS
jgi:leader peptidase (prepilin peptidase)/N-methyltransferase